MFFVNRGEPFGSVGKDGGHPRLGKAVIMKLSNSDISQRK